jgi:hypothetical protein
MDLVVTPRIRKKLNRPAVQKDFAAEAGLDYLPCAAAMKKGGLCKKPAGWGTQHLGHGPCKLHGGNFPNVVKRAMTSMLMDELRESTMGANMPIDIHPADALLELVKMCAGHVRWLNTQVAEMRSVSEFNVVSKTQEIHSMVRLLGEYEDRLARFAKLAIDTGIEERMVRVAERQGDMIAVMLVDLFDGLSLSPAQKELVPSLVSRGLAQLTAGDQNPAGFNSVLDTTGVAVAD